MTFRRMTAALVFMMIATTMTWAQRLEVMAFAGYRTQARFNVDSEEFSSFAIKGGAAYGAGLTYSLSPYLGIELVWSRTNSMVVGRAIATPLLNEDLFKTHTDQFYANLIGTFPGGRSDLVPYILGGVGWTSSNPYGEAAGISRFSAGLGGGFKWMVTGRAGLRFQAKWNLTYINKGTAVWVDWWGNVFIYPVSRYMSQGEFTGGLFFRF